MAKILVIEDEESYRENILELLEAEEFEAISADNGYIGLQQAQEQAPDLILCDVMMPQLDGYGVLKALRQNPHTEMIPFIFITAKADKSDFRSGMELGADDYLTKPFTRAELLGAIASRLKRQRSITQPLTLALQQTTERLNHLIHYDSVTNLPNRLLLRERFLQIISKKQEERRSELSTQAVPIMLVGLDRFNRIHDSLGHQGTDKLMKEIARRITSCLSSQDLVARLNVDQFAIVVATLRPRQRIGDIAETILSSLNEPFNLDSDPFFLRASIGITFYPSNAQELDTLMKKAASALYYIQKLGGNQYQFYRMDIETESAKAQAMETSLRRALQQNEFLIYYQPIVNLQTGQITGAEALVRWQLPTGELISPAKFIPLAEETGLIIPLGEWILQSACEQTQKWISAGFSEFQVSVNLSARQFSECHPRGEIFDIKNRNLDREAIANTSLGQRIAQILESTQLNPANLQLELTESDLLENEAAALATLNELNQLGIHIALDDFGTGYASLSYLKQFPFETLKIDRSFVQDVSSDRYNAAIMTAVMQLAHNLNLKVTAEGVETEGELAFLRQQKCDTMQGYLFSRPLPASEFEKLLTTGACLAISNSVP